MEPPDPNRPSGVHTDPAHAEQPAGPGPARGSAWIQAQAPRERTAKGQLWMAAAVFAAVVVLILVGVALS